MRLPCGVSVRRTLRPCSDLDWDFKSLQYHEMASTTRTTTRGGMLAYASSSPYTSKLVNYALMLFGFCQLQQNLSWAVVMLSAEKILNQIEKKNVQGHPWLPVTLISSKCQFHAYCFLRRTCTGPNIRTGFKLATPTLHGQYYSHFPKERFTSSHAVSSFKKWILLAYVVEFLPSSSKSASAGVMFSCGRDI
jgi:hypothetical protein